MRFRITCVRRNRESQYWQGQSPLFISLFLTTKICYQEESLSGELNSGFSFFYLTGRTYTHTHTQIMAAIKKKKKTQLRDQIIGLFPLVVDFRPLFLGEFSFFFLVVALTTFDKRSWKIIEKKKGKKKIAFLFIFLNLSLFDFPQFVIFIIVAIGPARPAVFVLLLLLQWLYPVAGATGLLLNCCWRYYCRRLIGRIPFFVDKSTLRRARAVAAGRQ